MQISKSQVYTHIRMSISTVYLYLHLHPYGYVYTQTLLEVSESFTVQPARSCAVSQVHASSWVSATARGCTESQLRCWAPEQWHRGLNKSTTKRWNIPSNALSTRINRGCYGVKASQHTHTQIHATLLEHFFWFPGEFQCDCRPQGLVVSPMLGSPVQRPPRVALASDAVQLRFGQSGSSPLATRSEVNCSL